MANRYYPEFYLRKRQRESVYKRVTWGLGIIVLLAAGVFTGYLIYKNVIEPRKTQPGVTSSLAEKRSEMTTQEKLNGMGNQPAGAAPGVPSNAAPSLDQVPYGDSMPLVQVNVDAGGQATTPAAVPGDQTAGTTLPDQVAPGATDTTPPAVDTQPPAASEPTTPPAAQPPTPTLPKADDTAKKPADKPKDKTQDKPKDKPKDKAKDQPKPEQKATEPPKPDTQSSSKGSTFVYRVYAGSFSSEEAAQQRKNELKALGFSGSVSKGVGEYNLFVAELDDLSEAAALAKKLKASGFSAAYSTRARKSK